MITAAVPDPRPNLVRSLDQIEQQITMVEPSELDHPTPCTEYDVHALIGHIVAVMRKLARAGAGDEVGAMPDVVTDVADGGWVDAFRPSRRGVEDVWSDDARLDAMITLPWGSMPGRDALDAYTHEFTAHSWDLAHALGRDAELDSELAELALDAFRAYAPPGERSEGGRFGPVVEVTEGAGAYGHLAAYLGRTV